MLKKLTEKIHRGKRYGRIGCAMAIITTCLAAAACGSSGDNTSSSSSPFVFLVSAPFSGATETFSQGLLGAMKIAASEVNSTGGILGHPIKLVAVNDNFDPTTAVSQFEGKIASGVKINAMFAGIEDQITEALVPLTTENRIITISGSSAPDLNDPSKYPYNFADLSPTVESIPPFVEMAKAKGWKKVALIYGNDATGQAVNAGYAAALNAVGVDVVSAAYDDSAVDMTPQLQKLQAADPDALVIDGNSYGTALYVLKDRAEMGWTSTPAFGDINSSVQAFSSLLPRTDLENFYVESIAGSLSTNPEALNDPAIVNLIARAKSSGMQSFLSQFGVVSLAEGFNAVQLVAYAARQANSIDPSAIAAALENLKSPSGKYPPWVLYYGSYGSYQYSRQNHFASVEPAFYAYVPPGPLDANGLQTPSGPAYFTVPGA